MYRSDFTVWIAKIWDAVFPGKVAQSYPRTWSPSLQPTASCQSSNCLAAAVHRKGCQAPAAKIVCKLLILRVR